MSAWTASAIGDLTGRRAVVTGANAGLGFHTALELARHGAHVVLTSRDRGRGETAREAIVRDAPGADVEVRLLDLADLASVADFAAAEIAELAGGGGIDILVNNAGARLVPDRQLTADGFELQFGTNHLGHFALTGRLLPALLARPGARVVTVTSIEHYWARLDFDDLQGERKYSSSAYGKSKLANLLFTGELQRRFEAAGVQASSVAAHPGWAATTPIGSAVLNRMTDLLGQPADRGALPSLYAATAPDAGGGELYGPGGLFHLRGAPVRIKGAKRAHDGAVARRLWDVSVELTGVGYEALEARARPATDRIES